MPRACLSYWYQNSSEFAINVDFVLHYFHKMTLFFELIEVLLQCLCLNK